MFFASAVVGFYAQQAIEKLLKSSLGIFRIEYLLTPCIAQSLQFIRNQDTEASQPVLRSARCDHQRFASQRAR